jgi:hypothetical protein
MDLVIEYRLMLEDGGAELLVSDLETKLVPQINASVGVYHAGLEPEFYVVVGVIHHVRGGPDAELPAHATVMVRPAKG